ncbi:uncharacterized protein LOC142023577 [Carettochelys insculpta]|uniref:uncharacterized protein LOC142023577 n=1 Tax=Carettochelys insculpta TaxID=44489 RepID=UPI003EB7AE57
MRIFPLLGWLLFPGCWAAPVVTGPGAVSGPPGGSVAVRCHYETGYESHTKFWCWEASGLIIWPCSNGHIVETTGSEAEVKQGRVAIRDNHTQRVFTVTVENLTLADAGTYLCGVGRFGPDLTHTVTVTVSSAVPSQSPSVSSPSTTQPHTSPLPPASTSTRTTAAEDSSSTPTQASTSPSTTDDTIFHVLIPCSLLVVILLLVAAIVLVRALKKRKKALSGASVQREKKINLSNLAAGNHAAGGSTDYAAVDPPAATDQTGFYSNVKIPPHSANRCEDIPLQPQASLPPQCQLSGEISYATLAISTPDQQPIYANVEQHSKTTHPANPPVESVYSAVRKKPKH